MLLLQCKSQILIERCYFFVAIVEGEGDVYINAHPRENKLAHREVLPWSCTFNEQPGSTCGFYFDQVTADNYILGYERETELFAPDCPKGK